MGHAPALMRALQAWSLHNPVVIAQTRTATISRVDTARGPGALKILNPGEVEEARGAQLLQWYGGQGAVQVWGLSGDAILMEWCDGPPLGDLARAGHDPAATDILCDVITTLHGVRAAPPAGLQPLDQRMAPLLGSSQTGPLADAALIARDLLATTTQRVALHGDLHHDNIMQSTRGWLAIDPKGVWGDPAYETANVFRNPEGAGDLPHQPARIARLAAAFHARLGHDQGRTLGWAAAHCALSTFWSRAAGLPVDDDMALLPRLITALSAI
jgi:streptomycin 6-kinase